MSERTTIPVGNMKSGWKLWRRKNRRNPSQTSGKSKNERCHNEPVKRYFATNPKAYKHRQYDQWQDTFYAMNKQDRPKGAV